MKVNNKTKLVLFILIGFIILTLRCPAFALPPDPDNAALLYYQAFCVYEKPDDTMEDMVRRLAGGGMEPNPTITRYIESCRPAIELAASAEELSKCNWGLKYSEGFDMQARHLAEARMLTYIILADARIALAQADYDLAIRRCLTARKLGVDVGQDPMTVGFLVEKAIEKMTNKCIQDILSSSTMELETLQQLKTQLNELDSRIKPVEFFLKTEQELMSMYITPERIREVLPQIWSGDGSDFARELILNADEQFCRRNLAHFNDYWSYVFSALKLPYQQVFNKKEELEKNYVGDFKENPDATMTVILGPAVYKMYGLGIRSDTFSNALKTALEIYEITAKTGQLPDFLPAGSRKDLYSGEDFEYEKTADGFILRCRAKDLIKNKTYEYEFKIEK